MGDLSEHFNRSEFSCKCGCGWDTVDYRLVVMLEDIRRHFDKRVFINSGCRCIAHNTEVGSRITSQHLKGKAADIVVQNISPNDVADYVSDRYPQSCGIGIYNTFTHIDSRDRKARWATTESK